VADTPPSRGLSEKITVGGKIQRTPTQRRSRCLARDSKDGGGGGGGGGEAPANCRRQNVQTGVDEGEAKQVAESGAKESARARGAGHVIIDGNNKPKAEGKLTVKGARPGIDGTYVIDYVMHELSKGDGWTTTISIAKPDPQGGGDDRKETTDSANPPSSESQSELPN
jgi:phage protein D